MSGKDTQATVRNVLAGIAALLTGLLATALVFEYGFGYLPCPLCLVQRAIHVGALACALLGMFLHDRIGGRLWLVGLAACLGVSTLAASYHAGIEWGFFPAPATCTLAADATGLDHAAFLHAITTGVEYGQATCAQAAFRFLGLSFAGWNALVSLLSCGVCLAFARSAKQRPRTAS